MILTVDRIEEGIATLEKEDMTHIQISISLLPEGTKEGSVLNFDGAEYTLDAEEEERRRKRMLELQSRLYKKGKKE